MYMKVITQLALPLGHDHTVLLTVLVYFFPSKIPVQFQGNTHQRCELT